MFLKQCLNYDKSNPGGENGGNAWTEDPKQFQDIGCISCYSNYNYLLIVNDATEKYVDTISELMAAQYVFSGVKRTLALDYAKNELFAGPGSYVNPNMNTFNSAKGYFKICASLVLKMTRKTKLMELGERIEEWDKCGIYDIWTTTLDSLPGTSKAYIRYPSRKFPDWLTYIEWWGINGLGGFEFIMIDDVNDKTKTDKDCFKGDTKVKLGGSVTTPWVGLVAAVTVFSSLY